MKQHETKQSGRRAGKHARDAVYHCRTWVRRRGGRKRRRGPQQMRRIEDMSLGALRKHAGIMFAPREPEREPDRATRTGRNPGVPMDLAGRFGGTTDARAELRELVAFTISEAPVHHRRKTVVEDGRLKSITEEVPQAMPESLDEFLRRFPSKREAVVRILRAAQ